MEEQLNREEFIALVEAVYLSKMEGHPVSEETGGFCVGISDGELKGRYTVSVMGPTGREGTKANVAPQGISRVADMLYSILGVAS